MPTLSDSPAWRALAQHQREIEHIHMRELFAQDPERFERFSLRFESLLLDYSKNRITAETMRLLLDLATQADLSGWIVRMFDGEKINATENRAAQPRPLNRPLRAQDFYSRSDLEHQLV
jgi:glucose-6-phosphate isomerase